MIEDIAFTSADLTENTLSVPDTKLVEFSIENDAGELVLLPRSYSDYTKATTIDFNGWEIEGTWHLRKIPVERGKDAEEGISLDEYLVQMYLLKSSGLYLPHTGEEQAFRIVQDRNAPLLGKRFYASGREQFVADEVVRGIIPCSGLMRQYIGTSEISSGAEGILYHFQVFRGDIVLYDITQDSLVFPANYKHHGNEFYFPELLPARPNSNSDKYIYYWRVRASYKLKNPSGELYWSAWSKQFPFTVNTPPPAPCELSISARSS